MSSSKKKKAVTARCTHCGNHFIATDIFAHAGGSGSRAPASPSISTPPSHHQRYNVSSPRRPTARNAHRTVESGDAGSGASTPTNSIISCAYESGEDGLDYASAYSHVRPSVGARLTLDKAQQREAEMPMEFFGWECRHVALMNPETIGQLGALPRSVAVLIVNPSGGRGLGNREIITLWPSQQIPQMRISLPAALESLVSEKAVNLLLVADDRVRPLHTATLQLMAMESAVTAAFLERLQALAHFPHYLKSYLSNGYVTPEIPVTVHFYTKKLVFRVLNAKERQETSVPEAKLAQLSVTEKNRKSKSVYRITSDTKIHVQWEREDEEDLR